VSNAWWKKKQGELVEEFGSICQHCSVKHGSLVWNTEKKNHYEIILEFAHKIGERITGMNRGRNARIQEVMKGKHRFLLLCHKCHNNYDRDNPLTEDEIRQINKEVPF
jgi:hypothetical protein